MPLFIIFIVVPLIELMILFEVGDIIGGLWTFAIIIATAMIGTRLVKQQGLHTWQTIQQKMQQGELPAQSLFDGICILVSGVLLITPGFMTDIFGMLLLTPPFRLAVYQQIGHKIQVRGTGQQQSNFQGSFQQQSQQGFDQDIHHNEKQPTTLDGEYTRKD